MESVIIAILSGILGAITGIVIGYIFTLYCIKEAVTKNVNGFSDWILDKIKEYSE